MDCGAVLDAAEECRLMQKLGLLVPMAISPNGAPFAAKIQPGMWTPESAAMADATVAENGVPTSMAAAMVDMLTVPKKWLSTRKSAATAETPTAREKWLSTRKAAAMVDTLTAAEGWLCTPKAAATVHEPTAAEQWLSSLKAAAMVDVLPVAETAALVQQPLHATVMQQPLVLSHHQRRSAPIQTCHVD